MAGVPTWMAMGGLGLVIVLSHLLLRRRRVASTRVGPRLSLLRWAPLASVIQRGSLPLMLQSGSIVVLLIIIGAGLFGSQRTNISTVLTWTWWWALLVFVILALGKGFCAICPWEGLASLVTSLSLHSRIKRLGFEFRWPRPLRNVYPALALFVLLTWFELGWQATSSPSMTAVMAAAMAVMAVAAALFFEKRAFCRYACLVGRISGIYALFSPVELRPRSASVCRTCETVDCVRGNDEHTGCPTHLFPGHLQENTYCTLCTECVRACPHDNLDLNVRPFGADLLEGHKRYRWDEATLALVLLALTSFHGITMTQHWSRIVGALRVFTGAGELAVFTVLMGLMITAPLVVFWGAASVSKWLASTPSVRGQGNVPAYAGVGAAVTTHSAVPSGAHILRAFAYAVIPVALFYHLAHNGMHFFMEGQALLPVLSDPLGWGWDLFGTAGRTYAPLLSLQSIWYLQVALIVIGHAYGVVVANRIAVQLFDGNAVFRGLAPFVVTMVLYSSLSIWLIAQPMVMRSGM
jgi:ferredoxin